MDAFGGSVPELVNAAGCAVWSPRYQDLDRSQVERAHALDIEVIPWTANEPSVVENMIDLGVDGLISDYPDVVRSVMQRRGWALPASCGRVLAE